MTARPPTLRRALLTLSALPLFILLLDLAVRFPYLRTLEPARLQHFFASYAFEWTASLMVVHLISLLPARRQAAIIAAILLSLLQVGIFGHYFYFGVLPNPYSVNYLIDHSADTVSLLLSSISWQYVLAFVLLAPFESVLFIRSVEAFSAIGRRLRIGSIVLFAALLIVFNNNVRYAPSSYSVTPATIFSVKYALQERWFTADGKVNHGYVRRRFTIPERPRITPRYNIVLFISESVRKRSLSAYGYARRTTPFLDSLVGAGTVIRFDAHTTNAVSTQFSVPMILSGNFTITRPDQPYIYDYIKQWTDSRTHFFTSQSTLRSTIDLLYNSSLDTFVCQEGTAHGVFNDLGVDDVELAGPVGAFHGTLRGRFFSVIQFNNTHFPYTVKKKAEVFRSSPDSAVIDHYDNTILEQDGVMREYFDAFRRSGLLDSTIILFTSDHGEAFGERGHLGHLNTLYGEEIDVPFWVYLPPGAPKEWTERLRSNAHLPTSHIDLFPTMMEMSGLPVDSAGARSFLGMSLLHPLPEGRVIPAVGKDMIDTKAAVIGRTKYIMTVRDGIAAYEAYRLDSDPMERRNVWPGLSDAEREHIITVLNGIDTRSLH